MTEHASTAAAPPLPFSPLAALGLGGVDGWSVERLRALSVAELLALPFVLGEEDPALSIMRYLGEQLVTLGVALRSSEGIPREDLSALVHRLSTAAHVAGELHLRELAAARR